MRAQAAEIAALAAYDTPTVCDGLERLVEGSRLSGYTRRSFVAAPGGVVPAGGRRAICGRARTVRIRASRPHGRSEAENAALKMAYYDHLADAEAPGVVVVEDLDAEPVGAFWGEVHTALHRALGALGAVTNGLVRDLDDLDPGFLVLAGGVGPSHAHVHWVDFGRGARVFGLTVAEGDVVHADRHGAVVVPEHAVVALPGAIAEVEEREGRLLALARAEPFDREALRALVRGTAAAPR